MTMRLWHQTVKAVLGTLLLPAAALLAPSVQATPVLTYAAWDSSQTGLFFQGLASPSLPCWSNCAGNVTWTGNNLSLEYRQAYGGAAWASTKSNQAFDPSQNLPSPINAVGIAFDVSSTYYPTQWVAQLDLGTFADGYGASVTVTNNFGSNTVVSDLGGGIPLGNGQFDPLTQSYFDLVTYAYSNGTWSVEMFYPDQWLFNRANLAQRFSFFATNTQGGPSNLVDGTTYFNNVRWILSDPFPIAPPPCDTCSPSPAPEPATLALVTAALLGVAATRRRRPAAPTA